MKKVFKYLLLFALVFSMTVPSKAAEEASERHVETQAKQVWYENAYYPVTPKMEEFKKYSLSELQAMLNPPQEILDSLSNEELASLMLDYPLLKNLFAFDNPKQAMQALEKSCDVFSETLSRTDMISALLLEHKKRDSDVIIDENNNTDKIDVFSERIFMEYLFTVYTDKITDEEQIDYKKYKSKSRSNLENDLNSLLRGESFNDSDSVFQETLLYDSNQKDLNRSTYGSLNYGFYGSGAPYTRSVFLPIPYNMTHISYYEIGTYYMYTLSVPCLRFVSNDYSESVRNFMNTIYNDHDGFYWLSDATTKYNCHSYVWLLRDTHNNYWLNNPEGIYNSYTVVNTNGSAQYGDKIVIFDSSNEPIHSAYVTTGNYYLGSIRVESKLGTEGLYNTSLADLMSLYQGTYYRVYR